MFTSNNISMEKDEKIPEKVKIDTYISQQDSCAPQPTPEQNGLNQPKHSNISAPTTSVISANTSSGLSSVNVLSAVTNV